MHPRSGFQHRDHRQGRQSQLICRGAVPGAGDGLAHQPLLVRPHRRLVTHAEWRGLGDPRYFADWAISQWLGNQLRTDEKPNP
jgi:hypothetical protein